MESKLTPETLKKCKEAVLTAKSAEEILAFAKQNGIEIAAETAADFLPVIIRRESFPMMSLTM